MFGFARPAGLDHQPKEDSTVKKRAKPRPTGAPTGRPSMFGFARPAGPDHGPKEDSIVSTRRLSQPSVGDKLFNRLSENLDGLLHRNERLAAVGVFVTAALTIASRALENCEFVLILHRSVRSERGFCGLKSTEKPN